MQPQSLESQSRTQKSIAIMILSSAYGSSGAQTALAFADETLRQGHQIKTVFFYHQGVYLANTLGTAAQDEIDIAKAWQDFIADNHVNAIACIASAIKRGIINSTEAKRYDKTASNICSAIELGGLGEWIEASTLADKSIVFGG